MNNNVKKVWLAAIIAALAYLAIAYVMVGHIDFGVQMTDKTLFYLQTGVTLLTIILIPVSLWYVRDNRFPESEKYQQACVVRIALFDMLAFVCSVLYAMTSNVSFFYLGVITLIAMFFTRGEKSDVDGH